MAERKITLRSLFGLLKDQRGAGPARTSPIRDNAAIRLLDRLEGLKFEPRTIVDLGCGTGEWARTLSARYRAARVLALGSWPEGPAPPRFRRRGRVEFIAGDALRLPLAEASVDLLFSNLLLQWHEDLPGVLNAFRRVLRPGGLLLVSTFGPDTLAELRQAARAAGEELPLNRFADIQTIGDALVRAGFTEPVLDTDWISSTRTEALDELRQAAAAGAIRDGGGAGDAIAALAKRLGRHRPGACTSNTWEIVYASAWAPEEGAPIRTGRGEEASVSIASIGRRKRS